MEPSTRESVTQGQMRKRNWSPDNVTARPMLEELDVIGARMDSGILPWKTQTDVKVGLSAAKKVELFCYPFSVECNCDIRGIVSDEGCDQATGDCTCKRNVLGRDCNQCLDQHYGLSLEDPMGCQPCDCDIGGSIDNNCDILTGQCRCRPNVGGRRCDEVDDGYFTGALDFLLFEGELARGSQLPVSSFFAIIILTWHTFFVPLQRVQ